MQSEFWAGWPDEKKEELYNNSTGDRNFNLRLSIIRSLESDEMRMRLFNEIPAGKIAPHVYASIIISFKSEDIKLKLHDIYESYLSPSQRAEIVLSLETDDKKIGLLNRYKDENSVRNWIFAELLEDEKKEKKLFKSDNTIIQYLKKMQNEGLKAEGGSQFQILIESIQSDDIKIVAYEKYKFNFLKDPKEDPIGNSIIRSMKSDDTKIQALYQYINEIPDSEKIEIIRSLESPDKRIELTNKFKSIFNEKGRDLLIESIKAKKDEAHELTQKIKDAKERDGKII